MKEEKRESRWKGIIMLVLGFIFMLPVLLIVMNSFKTGKEILTNFVSFPTSLYLDNFTRAMKTMRYASSFMNSAIITILTVIISLTVSYLAAYGILHLKGKLSSGFYIFFILGQVIPFHAVMIAITIIIIPDATSPSTNDSTSLLDIFIPPLNYPSYFYVIFIVYHKLFQKTTYIYFNLFTNCCSFHLPPDSLSEFP